MIASPRFVVSANHSSTDRLPCRLLVRAGITMCNCGAVGWRIIAQSTSPLLLLLQGLAVMITGPSPAFHSTSNFPLLMFPLVNSHVIHVHVHPAVVPVVMIEATLTCFV